MAGFCVNCGSPVGVNNAFCPQCGKPTGNAPNQGPSAPNPAYAPPVVPAAKGGSALKIIVVVVCVLAVGAAAVVGGLFYIAHRVKQAVVQKAEENGVDLHSLGGSDSDDSSTKRPLPKACDVLSKEDVSRLIGEPIERAEIKDAECEYYGPPGLSAKLAEQASAELKHARTSGTNARMDAIELQRMLNRAGAQAGNAEAGATGGGGELPLLVLGLSANGKAAMSALNLGKAILGAASEAVARQQGEDVKPADGKTTADVFVGTDVAGLGDKAMWTPKFGLYVLQGDILIKINPGLLPDSNTKAIAVARAALSKI